MQKYSVNQYQISSILDWVKTGQIAIPEIQRPFVWKTSKIRDLIDSLYQGYPIGYIITWQNPSVKLKDGTESGGKKILIDGQQRITALQASIAGLPIVNNEYKEVRVRIAFNPMTESFETLTPVLKKRPEWISDISELMKDDASYFDVIDEYVEKNPEVDKKVIQNNIQKLVGIKTKQVGMIELEQYLDIETVTEIFIRINSKGVVLSNADFAMSKIAAYGDYGANLRKFIDYFCHLSSAPHYYKHISENDSQFAATPYLAKIAWLKNENDTLYDPDYNDVIRTVTLKEFERGKISSLVSYLSGRDFDTKKFDPDLIESSFARLESGIESFTNETNFKRFIMTIRSAGYITNEMITAQNAINFAYSVFLKLREMGESNAVIESLVRRWFVMSMLTNRHSGSFESVFESDIQKIKANGIKQHLASIEESELGDDFWASRLPQELETSSGRNPYLMAFFAAQVHSNDKGFLSKEITVRDMMEVKGDVHHIFPRAMLAKKGFDRTEYNQAANFVKTQTEINITISSKEPTKYMNEVIEQIKNGGTKYGSIVTREELYSNLRDNCVPQSIFDGTPDTYKEFLKERRKLMAQKIKTYYTGL